MGKRQGFKPKHCRLLPGGVWEVVKAVPDDCQPGIGKRWLTARLGRCSATEADRLKRSHLDQYDAMILAERERVAALKVGDNPPLLVIIKPGEITAIFDRWVLVSKQQAEWTVFNVGDPDPEPDRATELGRWVTWSARFHRFRESLRVPGGWENIDGFDNRLLDILAANGIVIRADHPVMPFLRERFQSAWRAVVEYEDQLRVNGLQVVETVAVLIPAHPTAPTMEYMKAFEAWAKTQTNTKTVTDWRRIMGEFVAYLAGRPLTTAICLEWLDSMKGRAADKTIWNRLNAVKTIIGFGADRDILASNPISGVQFKYAQKKKPPFASDEVRTILQAARGWTPGALRWAPWILAYTGARANDICQLGKADVRQEKGIWVFDINDADDKAVKNANSIRQVPIHPKLIEEGILDYLATVPDGGMLFPEYESPKGRKAGGQNAYKKVGIMVKRLGITGRQPNHAWRHTFMDACDEAEVPPDIQNALVGHAATGMRRVYAKGHSLKKRAEWIAKVDFPGV